LFHTTAQVAKARHALAEQIAGLSFSLTRPVCSLAPHHWKWAAFRTSRTPNGTCPASRGLVPARSSRPINGSTYGTDVVVRSVVNRLWCSAESTAWPTVTWTVLILRPRRRSPRSCARLARCPGALTSSAVPPQRWMTPRPSSSRLRPAPAWSSSCTTSRCLNGSCSEARRRQFVEILSRRIAINVWLGPCCVKRFSKKMWPRMSRPAWRLRPRGRCGTGGVDVFRTCAIPLERSP